MNHIDLLFSKYYVIILKTMLILDILRGIKYEEESEDI